MTDYDGKYRDLTEHLMFHLRQDDSWRATFREIEDILHFPLPKSARVHPAWWANQGKGQSEAWMMANRRTSGIDLKSEQVTFEYYDEAMALAAAEKLPKQPLTIAEAKNRLAETFGVEPSQIEITIRA